MGTASTITATSRPWYSVLYVQVLIAIALGILIGHYFPETGEALKPLGDGFIKLIKMMIAPIIFCTVVHGIASMGDLKKLGRVGVKTLFYFEVVSTLALVIGLLVGELVQPGKGFNIDPGDARSESGRGLRAAAPRRRASSPTCWRSFPTPSSAPSPTAICCRCCWSSILTGFAISQLGAMGEQINGVIDRLAKMFFAHDPHHRAGRADRRVRRDGLHRRRLRRRLAGQSGRR